MLSNQLLSERYGLITEKEIMSYVLASDGENSLFHLLYEVEERADVEKVRSQARAAKNVIDKIKQELEPTNLNSLKSYMDALSAAMDTSLQVAAAIDMEDPASGEKLKRWFGSRVEAKAAIDAVAATNAMAKQASDTVENTLKLFLRNLKGVPEADKEKTLEDIAGTGTVPDGAKLKQGAIKAMKASKPGWASRAMNWLRRGIAKKFVAEVPDIDDALMSQFGDDILVTKISELEKMRDGLQATPDVEEPEGADEIISGDAPSAPTGGVGGGGASGGGAGGGEAGGSGGGGGSATEDAEEEAPAGKPKLKFRKNRDEVKARAYRRVEKLKKAIDDYTDNLRSSSRARSHLQKREELRSAIADIVDGLAGQNVVDESLVARANELLSESAGDNGTHVLTEQVNDYRRWRILAGMD